MANLGNLWFSVGLKDRTDADWEKIVKRVEQRGAKLGLQVDAQKLQQEINAAIANKKYTIDLSVVVKDNQVEAAIRNAYNRVTGIGGVTTQTKPSTEAALIHADAYSRSEAQLERSRKALAELREARLRDAEATRKQREENRNLANGMSDVDRISGQVKNQLLNIFSIYALERFITGLYTIGGEFQKQQIALETIIGDGERAEIIFKRIKDLSIESPFQFKELMSYTKQLSAFSIPYEELYDTTKRLADLSAGLGVDMGRIILAYGQVRSAEVLKGTELRQFTEAGIPLVSALADEFTKLEGRVVSAGEVFDKISNREVSFGMVKDVLWNMTNEGGQFYQMQERLSESLAGKWSNLQDAWDVMMADIADSNNSVLAGSLDLLTRMMSHWQDIARAIGPVVSAYGAYKVAVLASNAAQTAFLSIGKTQFLLNLARTMQRLTTVTKAQTVAQMALNAVTKINPWGLLASTIAGVAVVLWNMREETVKTEEVISNYNMEIEKQSDKMLEMENSARRYVEAMHQANSSMSERRHAYEELQKLYPSLFKNMSYEQALLEGDAELYNKVARAAQTANRVQSRINLERAYQAQIDAQRELKEAMLYSRGSDGTLMETTRLKNAREQMEAANQMVEKAKSRYISALNDVRKAEESQLQSWRKRAKELSVQLGVSFTPKDDESYTDYLNRIKNEIGDLESSIGKLNPGNEFSKETLDAYTKQLSALKKIYSELGGRIKQDEIPGSGKDVVAERWKARLSLMKEAESEYRKWSELIGKDAAVEKLLGSGLFGELGASFDFADARKEIAKFVDEIGKGASTDAQRDVVREGMEVVLGFQYDENKSDLDKVLKDVERQIEETTERWDVYKKLFDTTGNKAYSMGAAFTDIPVWDEAANVMRTELENRMGRKGIRAKIDFTESEEKAKQIFGGENSELYKLWSETKNRIERNGIDLKLNAANAIRDTMGIADKIRAKETQKEDALKNFTPGTSKYEAVAKQFENEILELKASLLELDPAFRKIFQDTTGMSIRQIEKLREHAQEILDLVSKSGNAVLDENGQVKGYTYTDASGNKSYIDKERYEDIQKRVERLGKKASEVRIAFERMWEWINGKDQGDGTKLTLRDIAKDLQLIVQEAGSASGALGDMFSSLGNNSLADGFSFAGDLLNSVGSIAGGIASGNPFAVISGIAQGLTSVFQFHDKKLQRRIEESERTVQELQGVYETVERALERHLGDGIFIKLIDAERDKQELNDIVSRIEDIKSKGSLRLYDIAMLEEYSKEAEKLQKRMDAYEEGGAYGYNRQLLEEQYAELEKQRQAEIDKKKTDESKVLDYDEQLAELRDQITYYAQDIAEELYGIDLKGWASQLGDSLHEAWQQGEDGAEAFRKKSGEIIGDVMNEILKMQLLEPMMQEISDYLFGTDDEREANGGKGGVFGTDFELDENEAKGLADKFSDMADVNDAYIEAMDALEPYLEELGMSMKDTESASGGGLSAGIKSITEDTADLLASYVNAIRSDVSIGRSMLEKFIEKSVPQLNVIAQAQLEQLKAIAMNTGSNAESAAEILEILQRNVNGTNRFHI